MKDVSEAVVEVAWAALHTQQQQPETALLALENDKLRKSVEVYKKVIADLENAALNSDSAKEPGTPDVSIDRLHCFLIKCQPQLGFTQEYKISLKCKLCDGPRCMTN